MTPLVHQLQGLDALAQPADFEKVTAFMGILRSTGLTPSSVREQGFDYAMRYIGDEYSDAKATLRMDLAAHIWSHACKTLGIHMEEQRAQKAASTK